MNPSVSQISAILNPKSNNTNTSNDSDGNNQQWKAKDSNHNLAQLLNVEPLVETLRKHKRFTQFIIPQLNLSEILNGDNNNGGEPILLDVFRTHPTPPKHLDKLLTNKPGRRAKHKTIAESDSECDAIAIGSKRRKLRVPADNKTQSKIPVVLDSSKYLFPNPTPPVPGQPQPGSEFLSKKRTSEYVANSFIALPELGYVDFCPETNTKYVRKILQNHHNAKASEGTKFPFQSNDLDFLFSYELREELDSDESLPFKYFDYQHKEVHAAKPIPTIPISVDAPVTDYFKVLWASIVHQEMPKKFRSYTSHRQRRLNGLATIASDVQDRIRRTVADKIKSPKEIQNRGRKLLKETAAYWRRYDKDAKENKKRNEKLEGERRKKEEEMREAVRQQNKLNFLLQQTELFTHFIARKYNPAEAASNGTQEDIKLSVEVDYNQEGMISKADAMKMTEEAVNKQMMRLQQFDNDVHALRGAPIPQSKTLEEPSIQQPSILKGQLKAYQLKGLSWLVNLYDHGINGILADEMGLGKTIQSIAFLAHLAEVKDIWGPFMIIAPVSTLHNWQQEIAKFCPTLKVLPYWGTAKERQVLRKFWNPKNLYHKNAAFHVLITSYGLILQDEKYFHRMKWQNMIIDEAQALKSSNSARWHILLNFNCRNRMLLTGTPIQNNMTELWALLHFIMPTLFDSHDEFNEWFSKDIENHANAQTQLNAHQLSRLHLILKPFMLRRTKLDVEQEIAKKIELEVSCYLTARQRKLYRAIKDKISIADLLQKSQSDVSQLLNLVMQFRKVCNHPEIFERSSETSPYQWEDYHNYLDTSADPNSTKFLAVRKHPLLQVALPKLIYREGLVMQSKWKLLYNTFNIFNNDYIHNSVHRQVNSCFSFTRLCDLSPAQLTAVSRMDPLELFLVTLVNDARAHQLALRSSIVEPTTILIRNLFGPIEQLNRLLCHSSNNTLVDPTDPQHHHYEHQYKLLSTAVDRMHSLKGLLTTMKLFTPKVLAPPAEVVISDRSFANQSEELLKAPFERMLLVGTSSSLNDAAYQAVKNNGFRQRLAEFEYEKLDIFHEARGIVEPVFDLYGSSHIWVPGLAKLLAQSGKLRMLDSMLTRLKKEGHRVLIYSQMTRMLDILEDFMWYRKHRYFRLDGSSKLSDRRDMVDDFQKRNDIFVFLLSTRAGGLGINLTAADTVIFYDSDWNPTIDQQAMDRAHRLGQTKQVTVYRLITKGTVEERILKRAKQKHHIQSIVISGGNFAFQNEKDDNLSAKEALSLLLDEDEIEQNVQKQMENRSKKRTRKPKDPSKPKKAKSISFGVRDRVLDAEKEVP